MIKPALLLSAAAILTGLQAIPARAQQTLPAPTSQTAHL